MRSVAPGVEVETERLLLSGDSSGCWCALHSVFNLPEGRIKALFLLYPMVKKWCKSKEVLMGWGRPAPGEEVIDRHLAQLPQGSVVSSDGHLSREELAKAFSANQHRWDMAFGTEKRLHPIERLGEQSTFPPILILHGDTDKSVKLGDCVEFVQRVGEVYGSVVKENVRLVVRADEEHGFEVEMAEEDEPWLAEQLSWLEQTWLQ